MVPDNEEDLEPGTERKILEAAAKVFMRKGRLGASMQDIADEAGQEQGETLRHHIRKGACTFISYDGCSFCIKQTFY